MTTDKTPPEAPDAWTDFLTGKPFVLADHPLGASIGAAVNELRNVLGVGPCTNDDCPVHGIKRPDLRVVEGDGEYTVETTIEAQIGSFDIPGSSMTIMRPDPVGELSVLFTIEPGADTLRTILGLLVDAYDEKFVTEALSLVTAF